MDREQEILAMALWVHQHHGDNGPVFITEQIGRCALEDEPGGIELWRSVAKRFDEACRRPSDSGHCKADR